MTIGVIIPDLTNPIFPPLVRGIDSFLFDRGYSVLVVNTDNNPEVEHKLFLSLMERQVDGLIIATGHTDEGLLDTYHSRGVKAVMVNRESVGVPYSSVVGDDAAGITAALSLLAKLGHKKILHISGPDSFSTSQVRTKTFVATAKQLGISGKVVKANAFSIAAGEVAMDKILSSKDSGITAVIAGNDLLALGVYHSLRSHGLDCPSDVSVIGFNDMPFTADFSPPMTTISSPHFDMGAEAARLILTQIETGESSPIKVTLPVSLQVRGSTASAL
jgi:LacI family transcriptional regulator